MNESPPARARPRGRRRAYTITAITAALLTGAGAAFAAVALTPQTNTIGAGGYDSTTTSSLGMTSVQGVVNGNQYGLTVAGGRHGVKMCNSTSGLAAAVGEFSGNLNTDYAVQYGVGTPSPAPGCPAGELPVANLHTFPALTDVPNGHHVWVKETLVKKTKTIRLLICVLVNKHNHRPAATPSPSITASVGAPTASPSETATAPPTDISGSGGTEEPSESPTAAQPTASAESPTISQPTASPTGTEPVVTPTVNPQGETVLGIPGFTLKCHIVTRTITKNVVLFQAQDLDAPVATPLAGDLAGVQTATIHVAAGTTFDHAAVGLSENTTALTHCAGGGFPIALNGTPPGQVASYASAACQEVDVIEYAGFQIGGGPFTDFLSGTTTELISPSSGGALVAPNGSITTTNAGPSGPASSGASSTGDHLVMFTGNAPVS